MRDIRALPPSLAGIEGRGENDMTQAETERADIEVTIQIGMETDGEILAVLSREAKAAASRALRKAKGLAKYVDETQWCSGVMRVTVRRPHLEDDDNE